MSQKVDRESLIWLYTPRLARKKWQFFGVLQFRSRVPFWVAERCFDAWILAIDGDRASGCEWFRLNQARAFPDRPLFHVLLGHLHSPDRYALLRAWDEIAGDASLEYFWLHGKTFAFFADIARLGSEFDIDFDLV